MGRQLFYNTSLYLDFDFACMQPPEEENFVKLASNIERHQNVSEL
jgi:hypothetical protein